MAEAMAAGLAKHYIISGGAGHTTDALRDQIHRLFPDIETKRMTEAELFSLYLDRTCGRRADYLETASTNCGNNITYLLKLIQEQHLPCRSIILAQDAAMQLRMDAVLRKYVSEEVQIINYAVYQAHVQETDGRLQYLEQPYGMWELNRYIALLMGEIPRLTDNADGYGPNGKNFLAHVTIPEEVAQAFAELKRRFPDSVREANPQFAS